MGCNLRDLSAGRTGLFDDGFQIWRRVIKIVVRRDDFRGTECADELVIDVDELRAVRDRGIQDLRFFFNGALKMSTAFFAAAGCDDRNRETVPAGMPAVEDLSDSRAGPRRSPPRDILGKYFIEGFGSKRNAQASGTHFKKTAPWKDSARRYPEEWRARVCHGRDPGTQAAA